jgi:SAM-dependent methyltransferase
MDGRFQRRIQRYGWDKAAAYYEDYWRRQIAPAQQLLLDMAALRPGERVLDIACGTGLVTFPAIEAVGPAGAVVGTDISGGMVEAARAEAARRGLRNVDFARQGAEELNGDLGHFDAALCSLGLMYVPDPLASLRASYGVLKPGGRMVAAVWGNRRRCGWAGIFPVVDARVESEVCPLFFQLGTGNTLAQVFAAAGFNDVATERINTVLDYGTPEEACGAAFAGGPVALAYSRFDERTRVEAHAEYLESIAAYKNGSGYHVPGEFVVVAGRRRH